MDIISTGGDMINALEDVQYCGETVSALEDIQYCGGYHQCIRGCSVQWKISIVLWRDTISNVENIR